ncbi:Alpha/Beta hydrolase protein [Mycena sp. CBHHK59/15]|nr:Alpha/Beta hydrolase protein [Mycena sp. CBHHK59/15]
MEFPGNPSARCHLTAVVTPQSPKIQRDSSTSPVGVQLTIMRDSHSKSTLLPQQRSDCLVTSGNHGRSLPSSSIKRTFWVIVCALGAAWFYANVTSPRNICPVVHGPGISYSGYIGLRGDSNSVPKRSFFWYFEAEENAESAPIILTIGGGPGGSGLSSPMAAQGPCLVVENGTTPNRNRWTEHYNLIALDHSGRRHRCLRFSTEVFPSVSSPRRNQFILSGGSYGGMYVLHIATVIHEENAALAAGNGQRGAVHINIESMMVSNPISDATSHFTWLLQTRCYNADMYNASTCAEMFEILPNCLESIQMAQQGPGWSVSVEKRVAAQNICIPLEGGDTHGTVIEDVRKKCYSKDPLGCLLPLSGWTDNFFRRSDIKDALGVPEFVNFTSISEDVYADFRDYGDTIQPAYLLYEPLLRDGIQLLHYVGAQDANCAWPEPHTMFVQLKLLKSPLQEEFLRTPDVPWPTAEEATVRVVGEGAGNMTYILVAQAGHFVARDQPALVKSIVEHWVANVPFGST